MMLERHGVAVQPERVDRTEGRSTGEILLAQATAHGADLLGRNQFDNRARSLAPINLAYGTP